MAKTFLVIGWSTHSMALSVNQLNILASIYSYSKLAMLMFQVYLSRLIELTKWRIAALQGYHI